MTLSEVMVLRSLLLFMTIASAAMAAPNFVVIVADDLGWADVSYHGGVVPTPNLDKLAREGVELDQHYVAPVCSPTRSALLSGRYWSRFGVTTPQNERAYDWHMVTLPRALKSVGYDTALMGKWHLGSKPEEGPRKFGFDRSYGSLAGGVGPWDHHYKQGPFMKTWHRDDELIEETGHVTDLITREAVEWIAGRSGKPFFLYVPFTAVHLPVKEPEEWLSRVPAAISGDVPRHYAACIMHLDNAVGQLVAALEKAGKRESTLIVFTSDNGGSQAGNADGKYPADDYPNGKLSGNNAPLRGNKGELYEGGIRVTAFANWPGTLKPAKLAAPIHVADWMPTLCGLAGYGPKGSLDWDGRDVWPVLNGASKAEPRLLYWAGVGFKSRAVRDGDWKLIVPQKGKPELFDLATDPTETTDLAARMPDKVEALQAKLAEISRGDRVVKVTKE